VSGFLRAHPAAAAAVLSGALLAARLLSVARFDVNTAAVILQVTGIGTAVAGTALTLLPFMLVVATCALGVVTLVDARVTNMPARWAQFLFWLCLTAMLFLAAAPLLVLTVAILLALATVGWAMRRQNARRTLSNVVLGSRLLRTQATVLAIAVVLAPILLERPWLPVQALETEDGDVLVGYLLGESAGRLAVMQDTDRTVRFVDPDDVVERFICSRRATSPGLPHVDLGRPLAGELLWRGLTPTYPACPPESEGAANP
jgi:hypothetical protein